MYSYSCMDVQSKSTPGVQPQADSRLCTCGVTMEAVANTAKHSAFWERLVRLTDARGMSLNRLAQEARVSRQGMEKWKDDSAPKLATLQKLAQALGITVAELTGDEGGSRVSYVSLEQFLKTHPELTEDEERWLFAQRFEFGDPGPVTWELLLATYRSARAHARS